MDKKWLLNHPNDLCQALVDEEVDVSGMSPEEIEIATTIMAELSETGDSSTLSMLHEADFWRPPPSIVEFLNDDFYLGSVCRRIEEENQNGLYPCWMDVLGEAFSPSSKVQQLILSGCLSHDTSVTLGNGRMIHLGELIGKRDINVQTSDGVKSAAGVADSGVKEAMKVTLRNGMELKLTPDHEVECCNHSGRIWKRADSLTKSDMVVVPRGQQYAPTTKLTDAEVKLLAYWPTDGSLNDSNSCATFTDGNIETCKEVLSCLREMGWNGWLEPEARGQKCWVVTVEKSTTSGFKPWLIGHQAHVKTAHVVIPPSIHSAPMRQIALFINRVWAAEGTVYNRERLVNKKYRTIDGFLQLRMKSERFIREMQALLLRFGILTSVKKIRLRKTKKRLKDYGHHWNLCINSSVDIELFFKHVGLVLGKEEESVRLLQGLSGRTVKRTIDSVPITGKWLGDYMTANGLKKYGTKWVNLIQGQRGKRLTRTCFDEWCEFHSGIPAAEFLKNLFVSTDWLVPVVSVEKIGKIATGDVVDSENKKWLANGVSVHNCIGSGKSFCGSVAILYKMARVLCMRNPLLYFGMSRISKLTFTFLSTDKSQVKEGAFSYAVNGMLASPFFNEQAVVDEKKKYSTMKVDLMKGVTMEAGSKARHALGRNVLGVLIDEINFRIEKDAAKEAEKLVKGLDRRYKSRFRQSTEGLTVIISSANQETDFLVGHMKKMRNNPSAMVVDLPYWRTAGPVKFADVGGYKFEREPDAKDAWFHVDVGNSTDHPRILDDPEDLEILRTSSPSRIMEVPIEHRSEFEDDLLLAIKDIGGRSTGRMAKYFSNVMPLIQSLRDYKPAAKGYQVDLSVDCEHQLKDFFHENLLVKEYSGGWFPRRDPKSPRFIHMDMSTGAMDAMGIAMVHPIYYRSMNKMDAATQTRKIMAMPVFELDFAIRLVRGRSKEPLDYGKIREFILWLRDKGFLISSISCDLRALSFETRNILKKLGFNSQYFSLDINKVGYETFKQIVHEDRFTTHEHDFLLLEAMNLEDTGKKIDHPKKFDVPWGDLVTLHEYGSKDLTDSVAGALFHAENARESFNLPSEEGFLGMVVNSVSNSITTAVSKTAVDSSIKNEIAVF